MLLPNNAALFKTSGHDFQDKSPSRKLLSVEKKKGAFFLNV
jgi:hypothetical protein